MRWDLLRQQQTCAKAQRGPGAGDEGEHWKLQGQLFHGNLPTDCLGVQERGLREPVAKMRFGAFSRFLLTRFSVAVSRMLPVWTKARSQAAPFISRAARSARSPDSNENPKLSLFNKARCDG